MKKMMHMLAKIFPENNFGENPFAVKMFHRMIAIKEFLKKQNSSPAPHWPPYPGSYNVINPGGNIAICTLTTDNFFSYDLSVLNVAITGTVMTPNLGIEKIILNIISNPDIRTLILCGRESPVFQVGQAFESLFRYGVDKDKRIINAEGHFPVLGNLSLEIIDHFIKHVTLINLTGEKQEDIILQAIENAKINTGPLQTTAFNSTNNNEGETFTELKPGGKRTPLDYDEKGFFVITLDSNKKQIIVKHYFRDNRPGFIIKGHSSEAILLSLIDHNLVSQMSHAGYLGSELAKAEAALKLGLTYSQDQSLKNKQAN
jgi:tetrahydromethanopterin S-methyltransferase subunit A